MTDFQSRAGHQGRAYEQAVAVHLESFDWIVKDQNWREPYTDVEIDIVAVDRDGIEWWIECKGSWEGGRNGLTRTDTVKKLIANAALLSRAPNGRPYMVVTSDLPMRGAGLIWLSQAVEAGWIDEIRELPVL